MSAGHDFDIDPWGIGWSEWDAAGLAQRESVFALSNGHLGWRGTLDEGDPVAVSGTYLNGVYERHPMSYAEEGYGYPKFGESIINVPDGTIMRLVVGDEPFDIRSGDLSRHEQRLDFRDGTLRRDVNWTSPAGHAVRIRSTRIVSLAHRSVAAIDYRVSAIDRPVEITIQSEIVVGAALPDIHDDDRVMEALNSALVPAERHLVGNRATLVHRTRESGIGVAVAMDHSVIGGGDPVIQTEVSTDLARTTVSTRLAPGESIGIIKFVGHEWSHSATDATLRDRADAAVIGAMRASWDALLVDQRACLDEFWNCADVVVEGSPEMQQAVRFALFQLLQASARIEMRSIPSKGLTGPGYEGHTFWDAETFALPVLSLIAPDRAREALRWRHSTLPHARDRARQLHLAGAAFPWRTIDGPECSGYWPAGTAAFHINADIAAAALHHVRATGDAVFEREIGLELLIETARLWIALGRWDDRGVFHIDGVTGPDEYSALVDDNLYTNLMAQRNLRAAAASARRHPHRARELAATDEEIGGWMRAADAVAVPYDPVRGVHQQSAGFTELQRWDFDATDAPQYPLQDHFPYFDLYRKQVVKQADLVLALHLAEHCFSPDDTARAFAYYEELTVRDSSLSASTQAVVAARVGHLPLAWDYLVEAATIDLDDLRQDVDEGLHIAALAGVWTALTAGFGGLRLGDGGLALSPRLTPPMTRLKFGIRVGDGILRVNVEPTRTTYSVDGPAQVSLSHFGVPVTIDRGAPVSLDTPLLDDPGPPPTQPRGRSPRELRSNR